MLNENERKRLSVYLAEYVTNVAAEWMRIVDVDEDVLSPGAGFFQARVEWAGDGTFKLGESRHGEEFGHYRLTVNVEPIEVPPIGPENDPAMQVEMSVEERPMHFGDDNRTACGKFSGMVYQYTDSREFVTCSECLQYEPWAPNGESVPIEPQEPASEWILASWKYVLTGDRVRLSGQEGDVERSSVYNFHADNTDSYRPTSWDHIEVNIKLAHIPNALNFPPNAEVEILMNRERKAIHLLQSTFDATKIGEK